MKKNAFQVVAAAFLAAAVLSIGGCALRQGPCGPCPEGGSAEAWAAVSNGAPVRVAVYVGPGARGVGMFRWMQLMDQAKELDATYVDGAAIRNGALLNTDLLVMPGGSSSTEANELGEKGQLELRSFIERGGSYIGTCAGAFLLMRGEKDLPDTPNGRRRKRIGIAPFKHLKGDWGGESMLQVSYTKEAAALCRITPDKEEESYGIKPGKRDERFNGGPVMVPSEPVPGADFKVMARFQCNLHSFSSKPNLPSMGGAASAVAGTFGKGRVWLFSCHPEYYPKTWSSLSGAFKFLTGRDVKFSAPQRTRDQLAVGWWCKPGPGPAAAELARSLVRDADFDVVPYANDEILRTDLRHIDALVIPNAADTIAMKEFDSSSSVYQSIIRYLKRGGKVVTWGDMAKRFKPGADLKVVESAAAVPDVLRSMKNSPLPPPRKGPAPKVAKPIRAVGYYDDGASGAASIRWIKLLSLSPECEFKAVSAADVRNGALKNADLYIAPGGMSNTQADMLRAQGRSNLVEFVRNGGGYFGTCAGLYLILTQETGTKSIRLGLLPYVRQKSPYRGGAELSIKFTDKAKMFGLKPDATRTVRYHGGPVLLPAKPVPGADIHEIALYNCDGVYSFDTNTVPVMAGHPAVIGGTFGKGRLAGTSPHPESYTHTQDIIRGGLKYITSRDFSSEYPQRTRGNLAVGFHGANMHKDGAMLVAQLYRETSLDVRAVAAETIGYGELEHCDALVISHPRKKSFSRLIRAFARNGGRIFTFGSQKELANVPEDLPNVVKCKSADDARKAILDYATPKSTSTRLSALNRK